MRLVPSTPGARLARPPGCRGSILAAAAGLATCLASSAVRAQTTDLPADPLDAETLALIEALTSTPTAPPPPRADPWPGTDPFRIRFEQDWLRDPLERDLGSAVAALPLPARSARMVGAPIRYLDQLRVESWVDLERLDPWLYGGLDIDPRPDGTGRTRLWIPELRLEGPSATTPGWSTGGVLIGRSADRSLGAVASLAHSSRSWQLAARVSAQTSEPMRVRTGTVAQDLGNGAQDLGATFRLSFRQPHWRWSLGYDLALDRDQDDLHLAQAGLRLQQGSLQVGVNGGWIARLGADDRHLLQAGLDVVWQGDPGGGLALLGSEEDDRHVRARLFVQPPDRPVVRLGGRFSNELGGGPTRAEAYAATSNRWHWLGVELSGRLAHQAAPTQSSSDPLVAVDARITADIAGPLGAWLRYAHSEERLELDGQLERVDLVEGGPSLVGDLGSLGASLWYARSASGSARTMSGWSLQGSLSTPRLALSAAMTRSIFRDDEQRIGPEPLLRGRIDVRLRLPEIEGFLEMGVRSVLERSGSGALFPAPLGQPPYAVVDLRGRSELGAGFALRAAVANATDVAWSRVGNAAPAPGIDVRLALEYRATGL